MTTKAAIVADAGPLIHLHELDALGLLQDFGAVHVTQTVWNEAVTHCANLTPTDYCWLRIHVQDRPSNDKVTVLAHTFGLHKSEVSALLLCQELSARTLLCDDSAARLAAESLGIKARGTLGILLRSLRRGQRSKDQVLSLLNAIPSSSTLPIRSSLLKEIVQEVEGYRDPPSQID